MLFSQFSILGLVLIRPASLTGLSSSAHSYPNHHSHTHHRRVSANELNNYKGTDFNLQAHIYGKIFMWEAYQAVPGMPRYQAVDFPRTFAVNTEKIKGKGLDNWDRFMTWVSCFLSKTISQGTNAGT